jgi:hypothetical protein
MARSAPRTKSPRSDVNAGRAVALAMEALGDMLQRAPTLPARFEPLASGLAQGRSVVPADGERTDFPARVTAALNAPAPDGPVTLSAWLGDALTAWLSAALARAPAGPLAEAVENATHARGELLARKQPVADVFRRWHGEGIDEGSKRAYHAASDLALGEAVDRWVALGCEGDLDRVVATWQRSSAGWAERALGTAVDVSVGDLGHLRSLQLAVRGVKAKTPEELPRAVARRMGLPLAEVERLLALDASVRERRDPERVIKRRWSMVKPIAVAVADLEKALGRMPSVMEIAERAEVHPCAVDLVLEAMGEGEAGGDE